MNIGDEIQSIAARQFLPSVDYLIHREQVSKFRSKIPTKLIMNAWWMWKPQRFPPSASIDPLLISMHLRKDKFRAFRDKGTLDYLRANGPVGARDAQTLEFLLNESVPAYLSSCLTLTLRPAQQAQQLDYVLGIDISAKILKALRRSTSRRVYSISPILNPALTSWERLQLAKVYLFAIQSAAVVVSPRLHAILPALALGTPAIRIKPTTGVLDNSGRFSGFEGYCYETHEDDAEGGNLPFDLDSPNTNAGHFEANRRALEFRVKQFTGFHADSLMTNSIEDAFMATLRLHRKRNINLQKTLWMVRKSTLARTLLQRIMLQRGKHDL